MTANWFEAKVKYVKVNEYGQEKKVSEAYLLDAMSYTEAESRIMYEMESVIKGDYYISSLKKSTIIVVFFYKRKATGGMIAYIQFQ